MCYCFILYLEKLVSISQVFLTKNLRKSVAFSSKRSERSKELWKSFKPLQNDQNVHFSFNLFVFCSERLCKPKTQLIGQLMLYSEVTQHSGRPF